MTEFTQATTGLADRILSSIFDEMPSDEQRRNICMALSLATGWDEVIAAIADAKGAELGPDQVSAAEAWNAFTEICTDPRSVPELIKMPIEAYQILQDRLRTELNSTLNPSQRQDPVEMFGFGFTSGMAAVWRIIEKRKERDA